MRYIALALILATAVFGAVIETDCWRVQITDGSLNAGYEAVPFPPDSLYVRLKGGWFNAHIGESRWSNMELLGMMFPDVNIWEVGVFDSDSLWTSQEEAIDGDGVKAAWENRVHSEGDWEVFSNLMVIENESDTSMNIRLNTLIDPAGIDSIIAFFHCSAVHIVPMGAASVVFYPPEPIDSFTFRVYSLADRVDIRGIIMPKNIEYVAWGDWRDFLGQFDGFDSLASGYIGDFGIAIQWADIAISPHSDDTFGVQFAILDSADGISEDNRPETHNLKVFPNPFNSSVTIESAIESAIEIFDVRGRLIDRLSTGERKWSPSPETPSGVYLIKSSIDCETITRRTLYLR